MTAKKIAPVKASKGGKEVRTIDNVKESFEAWKKVELDKLDIKLHNCDRIDMYADVRSVYRDYYDVKVPDHKEIVLTCNFVEVVVKNMIDCLKSVKFEDMTKDEPADIYEPCLLKISQCNDADAAFKGMLRWSIVSPFAENYLRCWHTVKNELEEIEKDAAVD